MSLPPEFVQRIIATFAPDGAAWLAALPGLLDELARRWELRVGPPVSALAYNYVAFAERADGTPVMLKLGVPCAELSSEIAALRHYAGRGACRLLAADAAAGALLLERLTPGHSLAALAATDDAAATRIAAASMARLWAPPPAGHRFSDLDRWTRELLRLRPFFGGGSGPFPPALVDRALALRAELLAAPPAPVVLHADLHHDNLLAAGDGWLAIDPKGVVGDPAYDCAPFLYNPFAQIGADRDLARTLERRIAIFAETLGLDRARIHAWGVVQAVLSAWWSFDEASGTSSRSAAVALAVAAALTTLRP